MRYNCQQFSLCGYSTPASADRSFKQYGVKGRRMALKLLIDNSVQGTADRPVGWCLDKRDLEYLESREIPKKDVHVLIVVAYEDGLHEDRYLAKLTDPMARVGFSYPGKHKVFARLVWPGWSTNPKQAVTKMRNQILHLDSPHSYHNRVLNYDRTEILNEANRMDISGSIKEIDPFEISVEVDKEHFAPEPPKWLKRWVNLWFTYKQRDECNFKWRALFAFTIQPIPMAIWVTLLFLRNLLAWFVFQIILGMRGIDHSLLVHPFTTPEPENLCPLVHLKNYKEGVGEQSSWYLEDADGNRRPWRLAMNPLLISLVWMALVLMYHFVTTASFSVLLWTGGTVIGVLLGVFLLPRLLQSILARIEKGWEEKEKALVASRIQYEDLKTLVACSPERMRQGPPNPDLIPKENLSIRLRVANYKAKSCRRYAGG
jgi:hypothetical protein